MKRTLLGLSLLGLGVAVLFPSCSRTQGVSDKTGWNYNDSRLGGFDVTNYQGQQTGPGLVPVQGGTYTMGNTEENLNYLNNAPLRRVTVSSFYMDETEVANVHYREYTYWMERSYGADYPEIVQRAQPDQTVWREALSFNDPKVKYYYTHAAYDHYPVVGVDWYQANEYCKWRTNRVNEMILIKNGILKKNPNQVNEDVFDVETYVHDQYLGLEGKQKPKDLDPNGAETRNATFADGLLLPEYRLPTEAEWEYAALGLISNNPEPATKRRRGEEAITDRKVYPWKDVRSTRYQNKGDARGEYMANYKRGAGDYMGIPGGLNDNADGPAPVYSFKANAYGLYNMAGNVSEWVLDVYRPLSHLDVDDYNPYRGNRFYRDSLEADGTLTEKDSLGRLFKVPLDSVDLAGEYQRSYTSYDVRSALDGDSISGFNYNYGRSTLINDNSRVIKGGSWRDRAYYLSPGTRRYMQANHASATVGFRCVMDRLGSPDFNAAGGNYFGNTRKNKRR